MESYAAPKPNFLHNPNILDARPQHAMQLYAVVRQLGVKLVLISGARLSTVLQRLPWLPAADAIVAESGGRIYYPGALPTAAPLQEDSDWRSQQAAGGAGPAGQEAVPPEERAGELWQLYQGKVEGVVAPWLLCACRRTRALLVRKAALLVCERITYACLTSGEPCFEQTAAVDACAMQTSRMAVCRGWRACAWTPPPTPPPFDSG